MGSFTVYTDYEFKFVEDKVTAETLDNVVVHVVPNANTKFRTEALKDEHANTLKLQFIRHITTLLEMYEKAAESGSTSEIDKLMDVHVALCTVYDMDNDNTGFASYNNRVRLPWALTSGEALDHKFEDDIYDYLLERIELAEHVMGGLTTLAFYKGLSKAEQIAWRLSVVAEKANIDNQALVDWHNSICEYVDLLPYQDDDLGLKPLMYVKEFISHEGDVTTTCKGKTVDVICDVTPKIPNMRSRYLLITGTSTAACYVSCNLDKITADDDRIKTFIDLLGSERDVIEVINHFHRKVDSVTVTVTSTNGTLSAHLSGSMADDEWSSYLTSVESEYGDAVSMYGLERVCRSLEESSVKMKGRKTTIKRHWNTQGK